jgi:hypothetical protein
MLTVGETGVSVKTVRRIYVEAKFIPKEQFPPATKYD